MMNILKMDLWKEREFIIIVMEKDMKVILEKEKEKEKEFIIAILKIEAWYSISTLLINL